MIDWKSIRKRAEIARDLDEHRMDIAPFVVLFLLEQMEVAKLDAARLMFACEFSGYTTVEKDRYDYAMDCAAENGFDEPNDKDELEGLRRLIDAAMAATKGEQA